MSPFPKGFYWGAATSAHQVEGGNHNDWSEWETSPARLEELQRRGLDPALYISGKACDHYDWYEEDFDIAESLGHNAHRFSIEWSRIEPEEGKFNEQEIGHYRKVIQALRARGIEPFVTLWHWPLPLWVAHQGAWENKRTVDNFARYCERVAKEFKDEVKYWMVLNEPGYWFANAYVLKKFPAPKSGACLSRKS